MKNLKFLFFVVLAFLALPLISSAELEMSEEFKRGETIVVRIQGSFEKPPQENNIYFERNGVQSAFDTNLVKFSDGEYFLSAIVPSNKEPGNYTITIENVEHSVEGGQTSSKDLSKEFSIVDIYADFAVKPAALESQDGDFTLEIENLKGQDLVVDINKEGSSRSFSNDSAESWSFSSWFGGSSSSDENFSAEDSFSLAASGPDSEKEIDFDLGSVPGKSLQKMDLSTENFGQEIFIYVIGGSSDPETNDSGNVSENGSVNESSMGFEQSSFEINMSSNTSTRRVLRLENTGNQDIYDVNLEVKDSIKDFVDFTDYIAILEVNETEKIELNVSSPVEVNGSERFGGFIRAENEKGNFSAFASISINVLESFSQGEVEVSSQNKSNVSGNVSEERVFCSDLNGTLCDPGLTCDGETRDTESGVCCLSNQCVEEDSSSTGQWIGWGILAALVGIFIWFYYKKYKKTKNKPGLAKYTNPSKKKAS